MIRDQRKRVHLSQQQLSDRLGVSRQWVVEVEKGKPRAEIGLILRALEALGLRIWIDTGEKAAASAADVIPSVDLDELLDDIMRDDFRLDDPGKKPS